MKKWILVAMLAFSPACGVLTKAEVQPFVDASHKVIHLAEDDIARLRSESLLGHINQQTVINRENELDEYKKALSAIDERLK